MDWSWGGEDEGEEVGHGSITLERGRDTKNCAHVLHGQTRFCMQCLMGSVKWTDLEGRRRRRNGKSPGREGRIDSAGWVTYIYVYLSWSGQILYAVLRGSVKWLRGRSRRRWTMEDHLGEREGRNQQVMLAPNHLIHVQNFQDAPLWAWSDSSSQLLRSMVLCCRFCCKPTYTYSWNWAWRRHVWSLNLLFAQDEVEQ